MKKMNTVGHLVINLSILKNWSERKQTKAPAIPILLGALLPDFVMFIFYGYEKIVLGTEEEIIWSEKYFQPFWQDMIDIFNSIPLSLAGLALAWKFKSTSAFLLFSSMLLHIFLDFPLHHDDGHRHFYPFSDYRFESPISYWDPRRSGLIVYAIEAFVASFLAIKLMKSYPTRLARVALALAMLSYIASYFALAKFA